MTDRKTQCFPQVVRNKSPALPETTREFAKRCCEKLSKPLKHETKDKIARYKLYQSTRPTFNLS